MEYSAWVTPDTDIKSVLPTYSGLQHIHIELLRFTKQGGRVIQEGVNGKTLNNSSVFKLRPGWFGSGPERYLGNPENIEWLKRNYTVYMDVSAKGDMIDDMINNNLQTNTVNAIVDYAAALGLYGVETNFEVLAQISSKNMSAYVQFLKDLGNKLHGKGLKFRYTTMSESVYREDEDKYSKTAFVGSWRNAMIADIPYDEVCLMSYDEQYEQHKHNKAVSSFESLLDASILSSE